MTTAAETRYEYGPRAKRGYAGMSPPQIAVLLVAAFVAVAVLNLVGGIVGLPLAVGVGALGGLLTFTRHAGLALPEWVPVLWQRARGQRRWVHQVSADTSAAAWPKALGNVASRGGDLTPYLWDGAPVGLLDVTAPAAFTLASSHTRTAATSGFAATLAGLAEPGGLVEAVSWSVRVSPADADALDSWAAHNTDTTAHPELAASYAALLAEAGPVGQHHTHTLAVRLRNGRETTYAKRLAGGLGPLVAREVERLAVQLGDAGVKATPITGAARDRVVSHLDLHDTPSTDLPVVGFADEWDAVRVDGSLFRVLWVEDMPRVPVAADFLAPLLLGCRAPRIVTLTARPVPADTAVSTAERQAGGAEADAELLARHGVRLSAARRRALGASQAREAELTGGHALIRYVALVAVSAPDKASLADATAEVIAAGAKARLRLRVLYGRQGPALAAVLPLARKVSR